MSAVGTASITTKIIIHVCSTCGALYGMPEDLDNQRRKDGKGFFCIAGHEQWYIEARAKAEAAKQEEKDRADRTKRAAKIRELHDAEQAEARAAEGVNAEASERHTCEACGKAYRSQVWLANHVRKVHQGV